jgi:hypothetical protein
MSEQDLDKSIDQAVRDIMNVDTDGAFRARVLARLEPRPRFMSWRRVTAAAAATAVVAVAVVLMRPPNDDVAQPTPNTSTRDATATRREQTAPVAAAPRSGAEADEIEAGVRPGAGRPFRPVPAQSRPSSSRRATVAETTPVVEIEPLAEIEAIQVTPVEQSTITPSPIVVAPLTPIAAVEIAPLSPQTERD